MKGPAHLTALILFAELLYDTALQKQLLQWGFRPVLIYTIEGDCVIKTVHSDLSSCLWNSRHLTQQEVVQMCLTDPTHI